MITSWTFFDEQKLCKLVKDKRGWLYISKTLSSSVYHTATPTECKNHWQMLTKMRYPEVILSDQNLTDISVHRRYGMDFPKIAEITRLPIQLIKAYCAFENGEPSAYEHFCADENTMVALRSSSANSWTPSNVLFFKPKSNTFTTTAEWMEAYKNM